MARLWALEKWLGTGILRMSSSCLGVFPVSLVSVGRCAFWRNYPNAFLMGKFLAWAFLLFYSEHLVVGISFYDIIVPRCKVSVHSFLPHCPSFKTYRLLVVNCWCSFWGFPPSIPVGWGRCGWLGRPVVGAVLRFPSLLFYCLYLGTRFIYWIMFT